MDLGEFIDKEKQRIQVEPGQFIYICDVCNKSMATQPAAMRLTENGAIFFCWEHAPNF